MTPADFVHVFEPPADDGPVLLMLHGTGGDERDLLPLVPALLPNAGVLSPRGRVLEHGMPRFFRRVAPGVFDLEDLKAQTDALAAFVTHAADIYRFDRSRLIAVGLSNGANIAVNLLLTHPHVLRAAVLFRAMLMPMPQTTPELPGVDVFISSGRRDTMVDPSHPPQLQGVLERAGANVTLRWDDAGHGLTREAVDGAREWLEGLGR